MPCFIFFQDSVTTLTKFCFPFDVKRWQNSSVQHFSFTLTDLQGYQRFGFCRLSVEGKSCTCILSCLPWFELFYKLLNHIAEHLVKDQFSEVTNILQTLYDHPVPEVNKTLDLEMVSPLVNANYYFCLCFNVNYQRNLTEFLVAVQVDTMLQLYSSLLCERRILITSSKLSTLTACVHASAALLYPMYWQHIYIPTLPPHLLDYCGFPSSLYITCFVLPSQKVNVGVLEDVVIFNMDTNYLETPFQDLDSLPPHVVSLLKLQLTKHSFMGDGVSRAFLRAQALLFGSYREALVYTLGEPISFCQETFLSHKCSSMKTFLQNAVHLQLFSQFIDNRLEKLNSGDEFTDLFEQEVTKCGLSGTKSLQIIPVFFIFFIQKGGGTLINNVKNRTHPTVRNMLRYAKGQAKTSLQGMKRRIKHKDQRQIQRMGSFKAEGSPTQNHDRLQHRLPITQHFGQVIYFLGFGEEGTSEEGGTQPTEENDFPLLDEGMDLLNEIFETLNTRAPGRERALYGAHSLDCFSLDDSQYFGKSSEEDIRLSFSQPRHSDLWYLQEVDEGTVDSLESPEAGSTPDNISNASDHASPIIDVLSDPVSTIPDTTLETKEDITSSSAAEVTSQKPDIPSSITEKTISSSEVIPETPQVISQTSPVTSKVKIILPIPEPDICPTRKEDMKQENPLPLLPQKDITVRKASGETPHIVSGPSVRSAISRFQARTLDPRMVWTGTKKETEQAEKVIPNFRSFNTQRPMSQIFNSPKPNTPVYRVGPVFLRTQSTPKFELPKSPITDTTAPLSLGNDGLMPVSPKRSVEDAKQEAGLSPVSIELKASPLPKVSELKKRFEVESVQ
uniref:UDENN domain-containing protein n=1 Tax=Pyxicephalus adspersus TaxID=30357 RepID=A0AAV3B4S4_PYXAD|nr:TPA: hypothetical protein GDO54_005984 [Pyxicephalus adspersus]